jgi:hypothetical protein
VVRECDELVETNSVSGIRGVGRKKLVVREYEELVETIMVWECEELVERIMGSEI